MSILDAVKVLLIKSAAWDEESRPRLAQDEKRMGDIVNLRRERKRATRAAAATKAEANRLKYGRLKSERCAEELITEMAERHLDQHKREP